MELAEVGQLVGAFLGGGLAKSVLDYVLADRAARRKELRPVDRERVVEARRLCKQLQQEAYDYAFDIKRQETTPLDRVDLEKSVDELILELDDLRLRAYWANFRQQQYNFPSHFRNATSWSKKGVHLRQLKRTYNRLMRRFNDLERKR